MQKIYLGSEWAWPTWMDTDKPKGILEKKWILWLTVQRLQGNSGNYSTTIRLLPWCSSCPPSFISLDGYFFSWPRRVKWHITMAVFKIHYHHDYFIIKMHYISCFLNLLKGKIWNSYYYALCKNKTRPTKPSLQKQTGGECSVCFSEEPRNRPND